jgi:hypothetical protein
MTVGSASVGPIVFELAYPQALAQPGAMQNSRRLAFGSVTGRITLPFVPVANLNGSTSPRLERAAGIFSVQGLPRDH